METLLILLIVGAAATYLIKTVVKGTSRRGGCACGGGCAECPPSRDCAEKKEGIVKTD